MTPEERMAMRYEAPQVVDRARIQGLLSIEEICDQYPGLPFCGPGGGNGSEEYVPRVP